LCGKYKSNITNETKQTLIKFCRITAITMTLRYMDTPVRVVICRFELSQSTEWWIWM